MGGDTEAHSGKGLGGSHHVSGTSVSADTVGTAQAPTALPLLGPHTPGTMGPGEKPPVAQTRAGGSLGQGGFPSTPFHSNNLQVGENHTPNFSLSVPDNLLLKCLAINGIGALVHSLTTHCTPAAPGAFPGRPRPPGPSFSRAAWLRGHSQPGRDLPQTDRLAARLCQCSCSPACCPDPNARKAPLHSIDVGIYQMRHFNEEAINSTYQFILKEQ